MKKLLTAATALALLSCTKQHRVRVSNYSLQEIDSVIIGSQRVTFANIEHGVTTEYQPITSGNHYVRFVCGDEHFSGTAPIGKSDGPDFTIQVDGLRAINTLEDNP